MPAMFTRRLPLPARSFLLLGPRGTGKTTWLRAQLPGARWYNLLLDRELLCLMCDPGTLRREIEALPRGSWVVVDEVQKLPALLNEVHDALATSPRRWYPHRRETFAAASEEFPDNAARFILPPVALSRLRSLRDEPVRQRWQTKPGGVSIVLAKPGLCPARPEPCLAT